MNKKSGTALRALTLRLYLDVLRKITLREVRACNELTVSAFLVDELAAALGALLACLLGNDLDLLDGVLCALDLLGKLRVEIT